MTCSTVMATEARMPGDTTVEPARKIIEQPAAVVRHNAGVGVTILSLWVLIAIAAFVWITWWSVRWRRLHRQA